MSSTFVRMVVTLIVLLCAVRALMADDRLIPASQPTTASVHPLSIPLEEQDFDASQYATSDWFGFRRAMANHGLSIEPYLILDYSHEISGGFDPGGNSFRQRFNLPITVDTEKLFGLHGGTAFAVFQVQNGGNASHTLTGDAQNFSFGTDSDNRTQLGQLWYQQKFFDDQFRLRFGKLDGNADFDVMDNAQEFLNNSFQTSPTLGFLPSFPETGMGVQLFYEPKNDFYLGVGVFDGSQARGYHTGEYGPSKFLDRLDNLFLIAEAGQRYKLQFDGHKLPGKIALGGWWDTNSFPHVNGINSHSGSGGVYLIADQLLWKPIHQQPVPAGPPGVTVSAQPQEQEYPGGVGSSCSFSWADPSTNFIDLNALGALNWTGIFPSRPIDVLGLGATYVHFSGEAELRNQYETAIETFYRFRFTQWVSLKPDLQYIIHPSGSSPPSMPDRHDALVFDLRLDIAF